MARVKNDQKPVEIRVGRRDRPSLSVRRAHGTRPGAGDTFESLGQAPEANRADGGVPGSSHDGPSTATSLHPRPTDAQSSEGAKTIQKTPGASLFRVRAKQILKAAAYPLVVVANLILKAAAILHNWLLSGKPNELADLRDIRKECLATLSEATNTTGVEQVEGLLDSNENLFMKHPEGEAMYLEVSKQLQKTLNRIRKDVTKG